jgi:hypothetical protein
MSVIFRQRSWNWPRHAATFVVVIMIMVVMMVVAVVML